MRTWAITHEGEVYREVDLTLAEAEQVYAITFGVTDRPWDGLTPFQSPTAFAAVLAVFLARKGHDIDETLAKLRELSAHELLRGFEWADDEDRPEEYEVPEGKVPVPSGKGTASKRSSTTTSSSSTGSTSGPPGSPSDAPSES